MPRQSIANKLPKVVHYLANFARAAGRVATQGFQPVPEDVYRMRLNACRSCDQWHEAFLGGLGRCRSCGCARGKLWLATEKCPREKWKHDNNNASAKNTD